MKDFNYDEKIIFGSSFELERDKSHYQKKVEKDIEDDEVQEYLIAMRSDQKFQMDMRGGI